MNRGVWIGKKCDSQKGVLIFGESHYGDKNDRPGCFVEFDTAGVIEEYFRHKQRKTSPANWDRFFDRIAGSFGYSKDNTELFYDKIYFGNYIDKYCGIGDYTARSIISTDRKRLNTDLFQYINETHVTAVVCFSVLVYDNLPERNIDLETAGEVKVIGRIGNRWNYVRRFVYRPGIIYGGCDVILNDQLTVWAFRHPSAKSGYDEKQVFDELSTSDIFNGILSSD